MAQRIVFTGKQQLRVESFEPPAPEAGQALVRSEFTLMSTGTENIVFNRLFDPGTHWDNWVKYPFPPGYCCGGTVEKLGGSGASGVSMSGAAVKVGDRVFGRFGHSSHHVVPVSSLFMLPREVDSAEMTWLGLIKIASMGARAAEYKLGDSVAIVGAGPIGQMTTRWAAAAGAGAIVVIDPVAQRLDMARRGGATATIAKGVEQCADEVKAACHGELPRVVFDTTGHPAVFAGALALARRFGRVVLLGDTGTPANQRLTHHVIIQGLTIVGAHDGHNDERWNDPIIYRTAVGLHRAGRFDLSGLNTHTFKPAQAEEAYGVANTRRGETMGILFDWRG